MFRLLIYALLLYLVYRLLRLLARGMAPDDQSETRVQGRRSKQALDLSGVDVEDAKFEEIKKKT